MARLTRDTAARAVATAINTLSPNGKVDVRRPRTIPRDAGLVVEISIAPPGAFARPGETPVEIETTSPAPKRPSRRSVRKPAADTAAEPAAETKPKPKRASRKKKPAAAEADA